MDHIQLWFIGFIIFLFMGYVLLLALWNLSQSPNKVSKHEKSQRDS